MQTPLVYHVSNNTFGKFKFLALKIRENVIHPEKEKRNVDNSIKLILLLRDNLDCKLSSIYVIKSPLRQSDHILQFQNKVFYFIQLESSGC